MATRVTPYVHSREEILNFPQISNGAEEVIAMPIVSDMGPVNPMIVNNRELLKYYTGDKGLKRSDDKSLKMAYILSRYSNLMVTRVVKESVTSAVGFNGSTLVPMLYNFDRGSFNQGSVSITNNNIVVRVKKDSKNSLVVENIKVSNTSTKDEISYNSPTSSLTVTEVGAWDKIKGGNLKLEISPEITKWMNLGDIKVYKVGVDAGASKNGIYVTVICTSDVTETVSVSDMTYLFSVYCNSAYSDNRCEVSVRKASKNDPFGEVASGELEYFIRLKVYSNEGKEDLLFDEEYQFSLDKDAEDGYGNSLLIDHINELQSYFTIVYHGNGEVLANESSISFGNSGYSNPIKYNKEGLVENDSVIYLQNALDKLAKYRKDIKLKILFDGGFFNKNFTNKLSEVAQKRKTLGVFSFPTEVNTFEEILKLAKTKWGGYNTNAGASSYLYCAAPAKIDDTFLGWREKLPYSLYYIMTIYNNISMNKEFAPVFGKKTGIVDGSNITINLEYSNDYEELGQGNTEVPETEQLQRLSINPVVYDQSLGTAFFVNNLTYQTPNLNVLSEENNRRLFNSIQFDINKMLDDFLARSNDEVTRQELDDALTDYKINKLDPLGYSVRGIRWHIEDYNPAKRNTLELTVEVCFMDSIKYIQVLYRAIPVLNS